MHGSRDLELDELVYAIMNYVKESRHVPVVGFVLFVVARITHRIHVWNIYLHLVDFLW